MLRATNLAQRLANIIAGRGKAADFTRDVLCADDGDGLPPRLVFWDAVKLGAVPTQVEVDAASEAPTPAQVRVAADESERSECLLDATIMSLVNQTRTQWRTWAGTNFPTLTAPERTRLGDLFWVVAVGVRQRLRSNG